MVINSRSCSTSTSTDDDVIDENGEVEREGKDEEEVEEQQVLDGGSG